MKPLIVVATQVKAEELNNLPLVRSLFNNKLGTRMASWIPIPAPFKEDKVFTIWNTKYEVDILVFTENKKGLPNVYNKAINSLSWANKTDPYDCLLFVHDDVRIEHSTPFDVIEKFFNKGNSIVGLAGASTYKPQEPALWHLASEQNSWSGAVSHPYKDEQLYMTSFGPVPQRCLVMDGLFLAVDVEAFGKGLRFDEQFTFHFYDIDFCLTANSKELKMTTAPIWCTHKSPGLQNAQDNTFVVSQERFLKKWRK